MDGLSGVASVIAVTQIALQIGQGISKVQSLLRSIDDAPEEIKAIVGELEFFDSVLQRIRLNEDTTGSQAATYEALARCDVSLKALVRIADALVPGFASNSRFKRKWAAVAVVRNEQKIAKFKAKLQEAKIDLLIGQQTSAAHAQHINFKTQQESLNNLSDGLAELCSRLSYSSRVVTPLADNPSDTPTEVSSQIGQVSSLWGTKPLQSRLEGQLAQAVHDTFEGLDTSKYLEGRPTKAGRCLVSRSVTVTRTFLGEIHCTITTYRTRKLLADLNSSDSEGELQVETAFRVVPSWLLIKFGVASVFKFDITKLNSQWQAKMASFNARPHYQWIAKKRVADIVQLIPSDSPIFNFCREGNLEAVRSLLKYGKASARDITETGFTPLHAAASRGEADICALLISEGADIQIRERRRFALPVPTSQGGMAGMIIGGPNMTPIECALFPVDYANKDRKTYPFVRVSDEKMEKTIRHFLRLADCFDEAPQSTVVEEMIIRDYTANSTLASWVLYGILPRINPYIMDQKFWLTCLNTTLMHTRGWDLSTTKMILSNCDERTVHHSFRTWVLSLSTLWSLTTNEQLLQDFNLLRQSSGGLNFVVNRIFSASRTSVTSLVFVAMRTSWSFTTFRNVLEQAGVDRERFIRDQIASLDDGWTVETLSLVFDEPPQYIPINTYRCVICKKHVGDQVVCFDIDSCFVEIPWLLRLDRIKCHIESGTPLSEHEIGEQAKWDKAMALWKTRLCSECCCRGLKIPTGCYADRLKDAEEYTKHWSHE